MLAFLSWSLFQSISNVSLTGSLSSSFIKAENNTHKYSIDTGLHRSHL